MTEITQTTKPRAWIVDVDGTLAHNVSGRYPYDDEKYELIMSDALDPVVSQIVNLVRSSGDTIIICSGRSEVARQVTEHWLDRHNIPYTHLFMRQAGDQRKDSIVKEEILDNLILPNYTVVASIDDRDQVVEMWRRRGIKCLQAEYGAF